MNISKTPFHTLLDVFRNTTDTEAFLALKYVRKIHSSSERGIEFTLTFAEYKKNYLVEKLAFTQSSRLQI